MTGQPAPLQRCSTCNGLWDGHAPLDVVVCSAVELTQTQRHSQPSQYVVSYCSVSTREVIEKPVPYRHEIWLPPLLARLRAVAACAGAGDSGSRFGIPGSRPPGGFDALATLLRIEAEVYDLVGVRQIEAGIKILRARSAEAPKVNAPKDAGTLRRWRNWCATATGLDRVFKPNVTCPRCGQLGTLRVHTDRTAMCGGETGCGESWGEDNVGVLIEHCRRETAVPPQRDEYEIRCLIERSICPVCVRRLTATTRGARHCDWCGTDYELQAAA